MQSFGAHTINNLPAAPTQRAYYDKPADRRLRPWVILGSILLGLISIGMIITPLISRGHLGTAWGIFAAGCALAVASLFSLFASSTLRPSLNKINALLLWLVFLGAIAVLVVNAVFLNRNMNSRCGQTRNPRYSNGCEDIRDYHITLYAVFFPLVAFITPVVAILASYLARTTSLYRKQEFDAYATQRAPAAVGAPRM